MRVVSSVNAPYLPLLDIWLRQSAPYLPESLTLLCMDAASAQHCAVHHPGLVQVVANFGQHALDRHAFWLQRMAYFSTLADAGCDFVHTDLDAFWLNDPLPLLDQIDADLVFSMDMGIPARVRERWGFTLCCGFFLLRSTPATRQFLVAWRERTAQLGDDQIALNQLLLEQDVLWEALPGVPSGVLQTSCSSGDNLLRIAVLPLARVPRVVPFFSVGALVAHPWFERPLFNAYLSLFEYVLDRFGRLDAAPVSETPLPSGLDECSLATMRMLGIALADSEQSHWLMLRGAMYGRAGLPAEALNDFSAAQLLAGWSSGLRLLTAEVLLATGQVTEAAEVLVPIVNDRMAELPVLRMAAGLLRKARGTPTALWFLVRALSRWRGRAWSLFYTWLRRQWSA